MVLCVVCLMIYLGQSYLPLIIKPASVDFTGVTLNNKVMGSVELLIYDTDQLERPLIQEHDLGSSLEDKVTTLLNALRDELDIWPDELTLSAVYVTEIDGQETAVIDFMYQINYPHLSLNDEWRLLRSITASLRRNGVNEKVILMNHEPRERFLNYLSLSAFD